MKVSIESNEDGSYTVSQDDETQEQPGVMPGMPEGQEQAEPMQSQGQNAPDLKTAFMLVAQMFQKQAGGMKKNPFQQGFDSAQPTVTANPART